jgi:hypothetical protein
MVSARETEAETHNLSSLGWSRKVNLWMEVSLEGEREGYMRQIVRVVD